MTESELATLGAIAGGISIFISIAATAIGYKTYKQSEQIKALDLRMELRKAENLLRSDAEKLFDLLPYAKKSHERVSAALGTFKSGAFMQWLNEWNADSEKALTFKNELPDINTSYERYPHAVLESKLIAIHAFHLQISQMLDKYQAGLVEDEKHRDRLRIERL